MKDSAIKNVWRENLAEEMAVVRSHIKKYNYVAMDTEFPGVVAKPLGAFKNSSSSFSYQQLRCNVDILNIIQLGISLSDERGNRPSPVHTWQFNFVFDLEKDMYSQESIELLINAKIDFDEHMERGIEVNDFGILLFTSGLVMCDNIVWISFHSAYDFAYLIKILTGNLMQDNEEDFYKYMGMLFPHFYDLKYLVQMTEYTRKGLQEISNELGVFREGTAHQAGSDALLTSMAFFKSFDILFNKDIAKSMVNKLYGIEYAAEI
ncbi:CCR4-NOT transcription complex subunit 7/8 [Enteropsectra breve]|nr:CCR4-NOT transcription complex subunit 7/8 [Enteropsectra breve]